MTLEEQSAYWQERTAALLEREQSARRVMEAAGEQDGSMAITERLVRVGYTGGELFKTAEELDAYIREERDSWEQ